METDQTCFDIYLRVVVLINLCGLSSSIMKAQRTVAEMDAKFTYLSKRSLISSFASYKDFP